MQNNIKKLRLIAGFSQQKLADRIGNGATKSTISKLEKGGMQLTVEWIDRVSRALNCSPQEIIAIDTVKDGSDLAIIYAMKEVIDMVLNRRERTEQNFIEDFGYAIEQFRQQNLLNAASVMGELLSHIRDATPQTPQQVIHKMRQLSPPKSS